MGFQGDWIFSTAAIDRFEKMAAEEIDIANEQWVAPEGSLLSKVIRVSFPF